MDAHNKVFGLKTIKRDFDLLNYFVVGTTVKLI